MVRYGGQGKSLAAKLKAAIDAAPGAQRLGDFRCAASIPTCRSKFAPRTAARCRVTVSSASCRRARGSRSIRSSPPDLKDFEEEPERWLDGALGTSDETIAAAFPGAPSPRRQTSTSPAALAQVATVIAEHDGNIDNISMSRPLAPTSPKLTIDLEVYDLKHLSAIIAQFARPRPSSHGSIASMVKFSR